MRLNLRVTPTRPRRTALVRAGRSHARPLRSRGAAELVRPARDPRRLATGIFKQLDRLEPLARSGLPGAHDDPGGPAGRDRAAFGGAGPACRDRPSRCRRDGLCLGSRSWPRRPGRSRSRPSGPARRVGPRSTDSPFAQVDGTGQSPPDPAAIPEDGAAGTGRPLVVGWLDGRQVAEPPVAEALQVVLGAGQDRPRGSSHIGRRS